MKDKELEEGLIKLGFKKEIGFGKNWFYLQIDGGDISYHPEDNEININVQDKHPLKPLADVINIFGLKKR